MGRLTPKPRKFFKLLARGFQTKLSIPVHFSRSLDEEREDKALIKSCKGIWHVKVGRSSWEKIYFQKGWREFVKHHDLKSGEVLVFEHKGKMVFHVIVYDSFGCEKEFPPPSFKLMMSESHGNPKQGYMTIPKEFVSRIGLVESSSLILRDPSGKLWSMDTVNWQGRGRNNPVISRMFIKKRGWYRFYTANKLKLGDVCTFELHQMPKSRLEPFILDVQIFCP